MNREQYLKNKARRQQQKAADDAARMRVSCPTCWRKRSNCLCSHLVPFRPHSELVLLMHPKEAKKQKIGTGRLTTAILENSHLLIDENMDHNSALEKLLSNPKRHNILLYPSHNCDFIDQETLPPSWHRPLIQEGKTLTFHILDATWPCAKKMMRLSKRLQEMPKISFKNEYRSRFTIKAQPHESCLSTIETAYVCYEGLRKMGMEPSLKNQHLNLLQGLDALVQFQLNCENDPHLPSSRGRKPKIKKTLARSRVRQKKNRLFYWDLEKSKVGHCEKYHGKEKL